MLNQVLAAFAALQPFLASFAATQSANLNTSTDSYLPKNVKAPQPHRLDAAKKSEIPTWIDQTRATLLLAGFNLNNPATVAYVSSFLDGRAANWWSTCVSAAPEPLKASAGFTTYDEFAKALRDRLGIPYADDVAREKLDNLRQTRSVLDYTDTFTQLIKEIPTRHWMDLRYSYLKGLKPAIKAMLVQKISHDTPWETISKLAHECDQILMADRNSRYGSHLSAAFHPRPSRSDGPTPMELGSMRTSRPGNRPATPFRPHRSPSPYPRTPSSTTTPRLNQLSDSERQYLIKHHGCFHCRKTNVSHSARNCPEKSSSKPARTSGNNTPRGQPGSAANSRSPSPKPKN